VNEIEKSKAETSMGKGKINVELSSLLKNVQEMRFSLDDGNSLTLDEVASYFNTTRERIRQIEEKAKLRLIEIIAKEIGREPTEEEINEKLKSIEGKELTDEDLNNILKNF